MVCAGGWKKQWHQRDSHDQSRLSLVVACPSLRRHCEQTWSCCCQSEMSALSAGLFQICKVATRQSFMRAGVVEQMMVSGSAAEAVAAHACAQAWLELLPVLLQAAAESGSGTLLPAFFMQVPLQECLHQTSTAIIGSCDPAQVWSLCQESQTAPENLHGVASLSFASCSSLNFPSKPMISIIRQALLIAGCNFICMLTLFQQVLNRVSLQDIRGGNALASPVHIPHHQLFSESPHMQSAINRVS